MTSPGRMSIGFLLRFGFGANAESLGAGAVDEPVAGAAGGPAGVASEGDGAGGISGSGNGGAALADAAVEDATNHATESTARRREVDRKARRSYSKPEASRSCVFSI